MNNLVLKFSKRYIHTEEPYTEVMGDWEIPLMKQHANLCCHNNGHVLEIGFGMGLFSNEAQKIGIKSHIIFESHPKIIERLYIVLPELESDPLLGMTEEEYLNAFGELPY